MKILEKIKGLFGKKETLSTLEIRETIVSESEIRKDFRNRINYTSGKIRNINDILLEIIKKRDPKAVDIIESILSNESFEYRVKYLRDRLKSINQKGGLNEKANY